MATLGVDVGGTKIGAGVVDESGKILYEMRESKPQNTALIDELIAKMYRNAVRECSDIQAIGIGVPGFVSEDRRTIKFAPNIPWRNHNLADKVSSLIGNEVPVMIDNDANVAGWAEFLFGVAKSAKDMVMVTVGTGIGGAIVIGNKLLRGHWGFAAEIGHMRLVPHGIPCNCGLRGCWEKYASGSAMVSYGKARAAQEPEIASELLRYANGDVNNITGPMITIAAEAKDSLSISLLHETGRWLGEGCAILVSVLDPEVIVIGGGVVEAGELLLAPARDALRAHLTARGHRQEAKIIAAKFGNSAGIVGAAALAWEK
jgi:glucokinase